MHQTDWSAAPGPSERPAAAVAPGTPTGLSASLGADTITLTWSAPADDGGSPVTGYEVFRGTNPGQEGTPVIHAVPQGTEANERRPGGHPPSPR